MHSQYSVEVFQEISSLKLKIRRFGPDAATYIKIVLLEIENQEFSCAEFCIRDLEQCKNVDKKTIIYEQKRLRNLLEEARSKIYNPTEVLH